MDASVRLASMGDHFNNGVAAYDLGRNVTDHDLTPGSPEAKDHEYGWHSRRIECERTGVQP
jgi:hypothetical protein